MSKKSGTQVDHILRKYPELLNNFDVMDNNSDLNAKKDVGLRRILRKHMDRCKKSQNFKRQPNVKRRNVKNRNRSSSSFDMEVESSKKNEKLFTCPVCRNVLETPVTVICGHTFCKDCLKRLNSDGKCFECGTDIEFFKHTNILVQDIVDKWRNIQKIGKYDLNQVCCSNKNEKDEYTCLVFCSLCNSLGMSLRFFFNKRKISTINMICIIHITMLSSHVVFIMSQA